MQSFVITLCDRLKHFKAHDVFMRIVTAKTDGVIFLHLCFKTTFLYQSPDI